MNKLQQNVPDGGIVIGMCATKCDLEEDPDTSQAEALAAEHGAIFLKTSSKTNSNVQMLFQKVTERVLDYQRENAGMSPVTLGTTAVETATPPGSPSKSPANKSSPTIGNSSQQIASPTAASQNGASLGSPFADEMKSELDESNDLVEGAIEMSDDNSMQHVAMSRCESTKLMCGGVVGVSEDGSMTGCVIQ